MAVSVELLDNYHKKTSFTIIVGERILLKFVPNIQPRIKLPDVTGIPDLAKSAEMSFLKEIVKYSKDIKTVLGNYVKTWTPTLTDKNPLVAYKIQIADISKSIIALERTIGISVCDSHHLSFCIVCDAYVGEIDNLTTKCSQCGSVLSDGGKLVLSYLDGLANTFLDSGFWFEDYIENLLVSHDWKVWTHGSVMGNSGIMHPIDLLAVKDRRVLIGECKTGTINTRDISHFLVQKVDIPSHFGLFLSLQPCAEKSTASFFDVSTSKLIDDIGNKTDQQVLEQITNHIEKFN